MAAKIKSSQNGSGTRSSVIWDEVLESGDVKIHLKIDVATIQDILGKYHDALIMSRGIPFDRDSISPTDNLVMFIAGKYTWLKPEDCVRTAKSHYEKLNQDAYREAMILAVIASKDNVFTIIPTDYERESEAEEDQLPGMPPPLPEPKKDLKNPVEYRLKQFMDTIISANDLNFVSKFYRSFEAAVVAINREIGEVEETDENGFLAKSSS